MSTEQITVRLPVNRVAALRAAAKAEHRSLAGEVEHRLAIADAAVSPSRELPLAGEPK